MYLVIIHVPIFTEGSKAFVTTEWKRSLLLLRDSLQGKYGPVTLLAPSIPVKENPGEQLLESLGEDDGIVVHPSIDVRGSTKNYWKNQRSQWKKDVQLLVPQATVVHSGLDQLWKPVSFEGFIAGIRHCKPSLFVADTDAVSQIQSLSAEASFKTRMKDKMYCYWLEKAIRWSVKRADLSLLKGKILHSRYGTAAKNPKDFHDTSYLSQDVIIETILLERLRGFRRRKGINLVYAGRFEVRKGLKDTLRIVAEALKKNKEIRFDLIGGGSEQESLKKLSKELGIESKVRFLGMMPYGKELLKKLATYDAILFTPLAEDTPRMIYDGFSAGLPLLSYPIPYAEEVLNQSKAGAIVRSADDLLNLIGNRKTIEDMSLAARKEGLVQAADVWYRKRAEWTFDAVERHRRMQG